MSKLDDKRAMDVVHWAYAARLEVYKRPYHPRADPGWRHRYLTGDAVGLAESPGSLVKTALDYFLAGEYDRLESAVYGAAGPPTTAGTHP